MVRGQRLNGSATAQDGVFHCRTAILRVGHGAWDYAARNKAEIESHWDEVRQSNPNYFDGRIFLVDGFEFANGELTASLLATNFRNYIFWRMQGFPEAGVLDGFGSALIRSLDGDIMLGRQRAGNVNAGLAYAPAGFIDAQDVDVDGYIDIAASAAREAVEETGVAPESLVRGEGFYLTRSGVQLSLGVPFQVAMTTAEFLRQADAHIAASENSELEAVVALRRLSDADGVAMPAYMRLLIEAVFADGRSNPPL